MIVLDMNNALQEGTLSKGNSFLRCTCKLLGPQMLTMFSLTRPNLFYRANPTDFIDKLVDADRVERTI